MAATEPGRAGDNRRRQAYWRGVRAVQNARSKALLATDQMDDQALWREAIESLVELEQHFGGSASPRLYGNAQRALESVLELASRGQQMKLL